VRRPSLAFAAAVVLAAAALPVAPLAARQAPAPTFLTVDGKEPKRPKLDAGADTNDARAYVEWGHLRETPQKKRFDGFYWAYRLEPNAQYLRLNMMQSILNSQSWDWRREWVNGASFVTRSRESQLIDSLYNLVYYREPFANLFVRTCYLDGDWLDYLEGNPYWTADHYYERGCYKEAAEWWTKFLAKSPTHLSARLYLVRALHWTGQHGNALAHIDTAIAQIRQREDKRTTRFYASKEQLETMRGEIYEQMEDMFNAKKAYGKALEENLAYWPAHVRLARLASIQQEHAEALQEYDQAVQLADMEPTVHFDYGIALLRAEKAAEAEREFRRTIELEPMFALAHFNLGLALDQQGKRDDAVATYRTYLARAPRKQARMINLAKQRVALLAPALNAAK
jgi:tetratricopeptide (TPR) repeat protein